MIQLTAESIGQQVIEEARATYNPAQGFISNVSALMERGYTSLPEAAKAMRYVYLQNAAREGLTELAMFVSSHPEFTYAALLLAIDIELEAERKKGVAVL